VAKVYPELVIRDENGRIDGVRYDELAPMLLNEVQKQAAEIRDLKRQVAKVNDLEQRLDAVLQQLKSNDQLVAQRQLLDCSRSPEGKAPVARNA
jgi:division protein CdvB (Snf7/Vps24/ESCRT-III family)